MVLWVTDMRTESPTWFAHTSSVSSLCRLNKWPSRLKYFLWCSTSFIPYGRILGMVSSSHQHFELIFWITYIRLYIVRAYGIGNARLFQCWKTGWAGHAVISSLTFLPGFVRFRLVLQSSHSSLPFSGETPQARAANTCVRMFQISSVVGCCFVLFVLRFACAVLRSLHTKVRYVLYDS